MQKYIMLLILTLVMLITHEVTHGRIVEIYDCEEVRVHLLYTKADCPDDRGDLAQAINEIIGYNIMPFLVFITFLLYLKLGEED